MTPHSHTDDRPRMAQRTDWRIARRGLRRDQPFFSFIHSSFTNFLFAMYLCSPPGGAPGFFGFCAKKVEKRASTVYPATCVYLNCDLCTGTVPEPVQCTPYTLNTRILLQLTALTLIDCVIGSHLLLYRI